MVNGRRQPLDQDRSIPAGGCGRKVTPDEAERSPAGRGCRVDLVEVRGSGVRPSFQRGQRPVIANPRMPLRRTSLYVTASSRQIGPLCTVSPIGQVLKDNVGLLCILLIDLRDHNLNLPSAFSQLLEPKARDLRFLRTVGDRWRPPMPMLDRCDTDPARTEREDRPVVPTAPRCRSEGPARSRGGLRVEDALSTMGTCVVSSGR
jgi:hypothetical protein